MGVPYIFKNILVTVWKFQRDLQTVWEILKIHTNTHTYSNTVLSPLRAKGQKIRDQQRKLKHKGYWDKIVDLGTYYNFYNTNTDA